MEAPVLTADQIRQRMREIRRDLRADVKEIGVQASRMFDWKNYVRSFPWGSLAATVVVGYLLVPRRLKVVAPAAETVEAIVREQQKLASPPPPPRTVASSLRSAILPALGTLALQMGVDYATKIGLAMLEDLSRPAANRSRATVNSRPSVSKESPWTSVRKL